MSSLRLELALLAGAAAAPLLPTPWSAVALAAVLALWLVLRPPRREVWVAGIALAAAVVLLAADFYAERRARAPEQVWVARAREGYAAVWQGLWREAKSAARSLPRPSQDPEGRRAAFRRLAEINAASPREGSGRRALLLLDPDGAAVAWAGEGLLHELRPEDVPRAGAHFTGGFSAVTLFAVEPLGTERRPWRVVAGASFPTRELPFGAREPVRWSLISSPAEAAPGALAVAVPGAPTLAVARESRHAATLVARGELARRLAWAAIGFALLALGVMRGVALALPGAIGPVGGQDGRARSAPPLALAGALAWGAAAQVPGFALAVFAGTAGLVAGLALAVSGLRRRRATPANPTPPGTPAIPAISNIAGIAGRGAAATLFPAALAWGVQTLWGPLDLAAGIVVSATALSLRLALTGAAFGLLALAGLSHPGPLGEPPATQEPRDRWAWLGLVLLLAAAALTDYPLVALLPLGAGGAAVAVWVGRRGRLREQGMALAALLLLAALAASAGSEAAYRRRVHAFAGTALLARLSPPSPRELDALGRRLAAHFAAVDLKEVAPRDPGALERQDLAFALWQDSPLARRHALSALVVEPRQGPRSSFSFGMPLTPEGEVDWSPSRWEGLQLPRWEGTAENQAVLRYRGEPWGIARWWLMPRPGFEVLDRRPLEEVEAGLLKGGPGALPVETLPRPALYALYDGEGRAALSPWEEAPPLDPELRRQARRPTQPPQPVEPAIVDTPAGRARAYARRVVGGWEVVYLPFANRLESLERTGNFAVGTLAALALATLVALLLALPRAAFRDLLARAVRSYSKRLLLVYTGLLLVPLLLVSFVLVRAVEERLERGQRSAGEAALRSAQQALGKYVLTLEPGFGIDTALNDAALADVSEVIRHELNLYWGSSVYASSRHELFTAGLLPKRIPGEIYARLVLLGYGISSRTNRAGGTEYLELYAPFRIPGIPQSEERLFLSIPLLAQQEEAARELAHLRRHAVLVTVALFALLIAVGTRLARNFTRPLTQLVEGTRRIAAGAPSLELKPNELELAALVEAIDQMARHIAEGRERLVREKQVVERMVENITSGVVSVDRERRVLMHNRVAAGLLGVATGENLDRAVAREPRLAPVAAFLSHTGEEMARATVRLREAAAGAGSGASGGGAVGGGGSIGNGGGIRSGGGGGRDGGAGDADRSDGDGEEEREWTLIWAPVPGEGEPSALLVVEDATEILRGQRLLAWAEMARIIAHEIKNPLTPIRLSAEHMREVYENDPEHFGRVFERCTTNILSQVDELRSIAAEFSAYSAIPRIDLKPGDLTVAIGDLVEGYRAAPPEGVAVELETDGPIPARFDAKLLGRAVRNLLENALRASAGGGRVVVRIERFDGQARVSVLDSGPGVEPDLLGRIFDPYFSTHDTGTGLGLPIARRIAEEHGGGIAARNRAGGGLEVAITLPAG